SRRSSKIIDARHHPDAHLIGVDMGAEMAAIAVGTDFQLPRLDRRLGQTQSGKHVWQRVANERLKFFFERTKVGEVKAVALTAIDAPFARSVNADDRGFEFLLALRDVMEQFRDGRQSKDIPEHQMR